MVAVGSQSRGRVRSWGGEKGWLWTWAVPKELAPATTESLQKHRHS